MRRYNIIMSNKKNRCVIEVGKFYMSYGGKAHPSFVFEIDRKHNTIKSIKFGTTKAKHMTEVHPLQDNGVRQYVHNRPFEGVRSDYGDKELIGLTINKKDCSVIDKIKNKTPNKSKRAKLRYK